MNVTDAIREAVVVRPGDRLLLTTDRRLTYEQAANIKDRVTALLPDVEVLVLSGMTAIVERAAGLATSSLYVNVDFNELLSTRSEQEAFELLGKLKDLLS